MAKTGRNRTLRTFNDILVAAGLPRWGKYNPEVQDLVTKALETFFQDTELVCQWVDHLRSQRKDPIPRRKFRMMVMAVGSAALAAAVGNYTVGPDGQSDSGTVS